MKTAYLRYAIQRCCRCIKKLNCNKSAKLEELYRRAYKILYDNRDFLLAVQKELLEHETLLNSDLAKIRESCT